jgi:tetratricopeptide (TPR) repeat protein
MEVAADLARLTALFPPPEAPDPFINRAAELLAIKRAAAAPRSGRVVLTGMGGVGKTALAAEYVRRAQDDDVTVAWLTPAVLQALPDRVDRLRTVIEASGRPAIVVLDDAEDVDQIRKATPRRGSVMTLVTTRDASLAELGAAISVDVLPPAEAAELIRRHAPAISQEQAQRAAEQLGGLPLALALAGKMIARTSWSRFESEFGLDDREPSEGQRLEISTNDDVRRARTSYERGLSLLKRGEYPEAVARLESASQVLATELGPDHPDALASKVALADALRLSGRSAEAVDIFRDVIRRQASAGEDSVAALAVEASLAAALRDAGMTLEAADVLRRVVPKMEHLLGSAHPDVIQAKTSLAVVYADTGNLVEAASIQRDALDSAIDALGKDHRLTLVAMGNLASMLSRLGRHSEARDLQEQLFETSRSVLGLDHPDTLTAASNLGTSLYYEGRLSEALPLEEMVFERRSRVLGNDHPDTLAAANNLAFTLGEVGRGEEALLASATAVAGYRRRVAEDNETFLPALLTSLTNHASLLRRLGRLEEAEATTEEAVTICRTLSAAHSNMFLPQLAAALNNQSITLAELGRLEEALAAVTEAVTIRRDLAAAYPDSFRVELADSLHSEALYLAALGRLEEALAAVAEAVEIFGQVQIEDPGAFSGLLQGASRTFASVMHDLGRDDQEIQQQLRQLGADEKPPNV